MKVLVIGGGAREHALVWKLAQSSRVESLFCSPGNGGINTIAKPVPSCAENDWNSYCDFAQLHDIGLTVVGPEAALAGGIADSFRKRGLKIFGPDASSARLESSKIFAKNFMKKHGIPTAHFESFEDVRKALDYCDTEARSSGTDGLVIKADGLAAGKGVSVCANSAEAKAEVKKMMVQKVFGKAGEKIVIEEKLTGEEISLMAFCDGRTLTALPFAKDYKRVFDRNEGPNTGGMGAISPCEVSREASVEIDTQVLKPFLKGLQAENLDYRGVIYFGLILTREGPRVIEFNVRFGDPEIQVLLPLLESDLCEIFESVAERNLSSSPLKISPQFCMGVVCASKGYPGKVEADKEIFGLDSVTDDSKGETIIFHAGTANIDGKTITTSGRVLNVVTKGKTLDEASARCYGAIQKIRFEGMHYRRDIGSSNSLVELPTTKIK